MGTWSAAILGNDTSCEVYERFIELYNFGTNPHAIAEIVLTEQRENIALDKTNVWLGLALACWECKVLRTEIYSEIKHIVESGEDLEFCKELDSDEKFLKAREKVLNDFVTKIAVERPKARVIRKAPKQIQSIYLRGMCLAYKNTDNKYIGVFMQESEHFKNKGQINICFLGFELNEMPDINKFKEGKLYGLKELGEEWGERGYCGNVINISYEKDTRDDFFKIIPQVFTVVGLIEFPYNYKWINNIRGGFFRSENSERFISLLEQLRAETKSKHSLSDINLADFLKKLN
ncbi:MAG: hypothetical protein AAGC65_11775 [Mucilaginibacter sp.]|uniref:hypothetical protein n=1 Tax=Mucilaginibacter sp. TaxID=1882438 RepID=UPI0031B55E31